MLVKRVMSVFRIGSGHWATAGVRTINVSTQENTTTVQCESSHLTSFAVLVDVAGGQQVRVHYRLEFYQI